MTYDVSSGKVFKISNSTMSCSFIASFSPNSQITPRGSIEIRGDSRIDKLRLITSANPIYFRCSFSCVEPQGDSAEVRPYSTWRGNPSFEVTTSEQELRASLFYRAGSYKNTGMQIYLIILTFILGIHEKSIISYLSNFKNALKGFIRSQEGDLLKKTRNFIKHYSNLLGVKDRFLESGYSESG